MSSILWQRLDLWARRLSPFALTLILVIVSVVPFYMPGFSYIVPFLALMAVYHWAIFSPRLLPAYAVFFIGILQDCLSGTVLGVNAIVFLLTYSIVLSQRRFLAEKSFFIIWFGFSLILLVVIFLTWSLFSAYNVVLINPKSLFFQYFVSLGLFPLISWFFQRWQHAFLKTE